MKSHNSNELLKNEDEFKMNMNVNSLNSEWIEYIQINRKQLIENN